MNELVRKLRNRLVNLVLRAVVDRSGHTYQVRHLGDRVAPGTENFQPQGVYFRVPAGAECVLVSPAGETANAVMLGAHLRSAEPDDMVPDGCGGLHRLGTFAVYVDANDVVHLGGGISAAHFVALSDLVDARIAAIRTAFNAHTHSGVTTGGGASGPPAAPLAAQASVAATKVKAT